MNVFSKYSVVKPLSLEYPWLVAFTTLAERNGRRVDFTAGTCEAERRELESVLAPLSVAWLALEHGARIIEMGSEGGFCDFAELPALAQNEQGLASGLAITASCSPKADGAILTEPGRAVAFTTADCLPIVVVSERPRVVAAIHAGWRSIAAGIIEAAVEQLQQHYGVDPATLKVWIGPSIAQEDYEVSDEVRDRLLLRGAIAEHHFTSTGPGHWLADLPGAATAIFTSLGVVGSSIERYFVSTARSPLLHSARRDGSASGRMATVVGIMKVDQP